jgi:hypothetical protein
MKWKWSGQTMKPHVFPTGFSKFMETLPHASFLLAHGIDLDVRMPV